MTEAEELAKARLHNAQAKSRGAFQYALRRRLRGNPVAAKAVYDGMSAPLKASQESRADAGGESC